VSEGSRVPNTARRSVSILSYRHFAGSFLNFRGKKMDDFSLLEQNKVDIAPLSTRMRPQGFSEFVGQEKILGPETLLKKSISQDNLRSAIFWGPPGTGKTTLAKIVANMTEAHFREISAVTSNVSEIRKIIAQAKERFTTGGQKTLLLIDEIHRFNKTQQDALLPVLEDGLIILIGITTENPYFEITSPLISRSRIFQFDSLSPAHLKEIVQRALNDKERGLGKFIVKLEKEALEHIVKVAGGDARSALNALEMAVMSVKPDQKGLRKITLKVAEDALQKKAIKYDKDGDEHYNTISAFIKSMRGSDPDATLYWLARMLYAGEDPKFIARRIVIAASEDVGLADSRALEVAVAASRAVEFVGLPEARLNLAHAALYLAMAPKSNSVIVGIDEALRDVEREGTPEVPRHLRDSGYPGAKKLGHGKDYKYPHNYPGHKVSQEYLPLDRKRKRYYRPSGTGEDRSPSH